MEKGREIRDNMRVDGRVKERVENEMKMQTRERKNGGKKKKEIEETLDGQEEKLRNKKTIEGRSVNRRMKERRKLDWHRDGNRKRKKS